MSKQNGRGQPSKPDIVEKYSIRFRANYPDLKPKLEKLAKQSGNSLNDYIQIILNDHIEKMNPKNNKEIHELEYSFDLLFENIRMELETLESNSETFKHVESLTFEDFVKTNFSNPFERKLLYLSILNNQIYSERVLLSFLLHYKTEFQEKRSYNYIDFYKNFFTLEENIEENKIESKITKDFYENWFLHLKLFNIFEKKPRFKVNYVNLENFIFSVLCADIIVDPLFSKKEYDELNKKWKVILKSWSFIGIDRNRSLNIKNIKYFKNNFEIIRKKYYDDFYSYLKEREVVHNFLKGNYCVSPQEIEMILKESGDSKSAMEPLEDLKKLTLADPKYIKKYYEVMLIFLKSIRYEYLSRFEETLFPSRIPEVNSSDFEKEDYFMNLDRFFDNLMFNQENIMDIEGFSRLRVFFKELKYYSFFYFKPYILKKVLKLNDFYEFQKEKGIIINFFSNDLINKIAKENSLKDYLENQL